MTRDAIPILNISDYFDDFGNASGIDAVRAVSVRPEWMPRSIFNVLAETYGFRPATDNDLFPCGMNRYDKLRKIIFETTGGSFSFPLLDFQPKAQIAQSAVDQIKAIGQKVLCIKKIGEKQTGLYSELRRATADPVEGVQAISSGKGSRYSGKYKYKDDSDVTRLVSLSIETDSKGYPPTILDTAWALCAGSPLAVQCASPSNIRPRYFMLKTLYQDGSIPPTTGEQSHKVPHATSSPGDLVRLCGAALADLDSAFCLDYQGETDMAYNRTLGINL